jgi:predicted metalloenzyme YecM
LAFIVGNYTNTGRLTTALLSCALVNGCSIELVSTNAPVRLKVIDSGTSLEAA